LILSCRSFLSLFSFLLCCICSSSLLLQQLLFFLISFFYSMATERALSGSGLGTDRAAVVRDGWVLGGSRGSDGSGWAAAARRSTGLWTGQRRRGGTTWLDRAHRAAVVILKKWAAALADLVN
jgi:hypothetical protein